MEGNKQSFFRSKPALALYGLIILGVVGLLIYFNLPFRIVNTNPGTNQVALSTPFFNINFNKPVTKDALLVSASPSDLIRSYSVMGNTLHINLNYPLQLNLPYSIHLGSISSISGEVVENKTFNFTPKNISYDNLPADQKKALIDNQDQYPAAQTDPILKHLPRSTLDYRIDPVFTSVQGTEKLTLQIQLLIPPNQPNAVALAEQYKAEALQYIHSLGLNAANYTITYQVVTETLGGR